MFRSHSKIWYVNLRTNSDFRSRSFDLFPPTRSETMQLFFKRMRFGKIAFDSVDKQLEPSYHEIVSKIKFTSAARKSSDIISLSFDKWKRFWQCKFHWRSHIFSLEEVLFGAYKLRGFLWSSGDIWLSEQSLGFIRFES